MNSQKNVFIGKSGKGIEKLHKEISKICKGAYLTDYLGQKLIAVYDEVDYRVATIVGNYIASKNQYDVKWVDSDGKVYKKDKFCICQIPKSFLSDYEVEEFTKNLSKTINVPIIYKLNSREQFYVTEPIYEININLLDIFSDESSKEFGYDKILEVVDLKLNQIKSYANEWFKTKNQQSYTIIDFNGEVIETKCQNEHLVMLALKEYFLSSSLRFGIFHPEGLNLSPKPNEEDYDEDNAEEFWVNSYKYGLDNIDEFDLKKINEKSILQDIIYKFHYFESYGVNKFGDIRKSFGFNDEVKVSYGINILSDTKLRVVAKVSGTRKTEGKKLTKSKIVYDELLKGSKYEDCKYEFSVTDYYEIIDFNMLLHYTDASKFYEVYEIPVGFKFEDGNLDKLKKVVYDDGNSNWINYSNISEVIEALTK